MDPKSPQRFLTSVEVAAACGVSARTVSNWIRDGSIPAHRTVGGHGRVAVEDLRKFLEARGMAAPGGLTPTRDVPAPEPRPPWGGTERRQRVLVIDDDETLLEVMREVLGSSGLEVETARHGFLAGYLVAHHHPDVIVLDILMPGLDGFDVLSLMRRLPEARGIPVIACTSLKGAETEARIRGAGFAAYARKPIDFRALLETISGLVR